MEVTFVTYISVYILVLFVTNVTGFNITEVGNVNIYNSPVNLHFESQDVTIIERKIEDFYFNYTIHDDNYQICKLAAKILDPANADIIGDKEIIIRKYNARNTNGTKFSLRGKFLGRTLLEFFVQPLVGNGSFNTSTISSGNPDYVHDGWRKLPDSESVRVAVIRKKRPRDYIFTLVISLFIVLSNIGMGCKIDLEVVKEVLKRPLAPAIGFGCQFIFMPLLSFGIIKLLKFKGGIALGFFAMGCSPGGGASNMYTFLLDGEVSLSITMTLISTLSSLAMIPLWMFTLGGLLLDETTNVSIPYQNICISLIVLIAPCCIGIGIQKIRPLWAKKIIKILKPMYFGFIIFMLSFGIYVNLFVFKLFTPILILAGCLLPYCGFSLGGICAFILRQPKARIIAICIETGMQNTGVAILILKFALPQPDADLSLVSPLVTTTFTPLPLLVAVITYNFYKKFCKKTDFEQVPIKEDSSDLPKEMEDFSEKKNLNHENDMNNKKD